jgi:predicted ArsR family transcriptional regulator
VENSNLSEARHARHRALSGATRLRLLDRLRRSEGPMSVRQLASELHLHENSVREQLDRLVAVELVAEVEAPPAGRGRPPRRYAAAVSVADEQETGAFRELALVLAEHVARGPDPAEAAMEAGERWGRAVAAEMPAAREAAPAMRRIMALLDRAGFSPEEPLGPGDPISLHRCPFGELAINSEGAVCLLHLGMLRGVLRTLGAPFEAIRVEPFVAPGLCFAFLESRPADA